MEKLLRVNIGCGMSPTANWLNFDNSWSVRLANHSVLVWLLNFFNLLNKTQLHFIHFCQNENIVWADSTKKIPLPDNSADVIYSSHMLEHLDKDEVSSFLTEVKRVLCRGGILRLAIPDLQKLVDYYIHNKDADAFIDSLNICKPKPKSYKNKLMVLIIGNRFHHWQYDSESLSSLLLKHGFSNVYVLKKGETKIIEPGRLNLNEDAGDSMYVEAIL